MMKNQTILVALAAATFCSVANASITSASWQDDGDGAIKCSWSPFNPATSTLSMVGDQYWAPAHMVGTVTTDTPSDPSLTLDSSVNNDTGFSWTGYRVNVYMAEPFTFTPFSENITLPSDWTVASVQQPMLSGSEYEGTIFYSGPDPIAPGQSIDFGYQIAFSGGSSIAFTQEMMPIAVPEPASFGLIAGLALCAAAVGSRLRGWQQVRLMSGVPAFATSVTRAR
jgi:hypothetical protein